MQIKIGSIISILAIALTHMVNAQSTKPIIKQTIIIQKNSDSADKMLIKVDGNQMTINGKPVNDKVIDSILSTINGDKEKKMTEYFKKSQMYSDGAKPDFPFTNKTITITIDLGCENHKVFTVLGGDLTTDYVNINANYRS